MPDERIAAGLHCGEVQADLTESLDGRLSRERAQRIEEHLLECDGCRRLCDEIAAAVRAVRELPQEPLDAETESRLFSRLHG
ncbi:MAG TPA: zf-HC2 domain-containing protein [Thermoanaerobaculia bacterium]|jgi:anti-sigma factor RsiW|nr:zf-HC2 domain-containing protein [Thermoanaerobaculia bacterium]